MNLTTNQIVEMTKWMPGSNIICKIKDQVITQKYCNGEVSNMLGFTQEEYEQYKNPFVLVFEEDRDIIHNKIINCFLFEQKENGEFSFRLIHKEKGFIWVHMSARVVERSGEAIVYVGSLVDVTKEMENSYALMEATERCICVIEKFSKRFLYANTPFYRLIDFTPAQAMGKHCYELLCKTMEMKNNDNCLCYSCINAKEQVEFYNEQKKSYLTMTGREIQWGEHESYVFYLTDITREKEKDAQLADSAKRFNVALDNSDLMIWEYDMINHRCINSEKAGRDYDIPLIIENYPESLYETGYTPPETIEQIKDVKRRLENGETGFSVERRTIDKYGKSNWQKVDYTLECDASGKPVRAIVCGLDITEKKKLEEKYARQQEYRNNLAKKSLFSIQLDLEENVVMEYTCNEALLEQVMKKSHTAAEFMENFFETSVFSPDSQMSRERLNPQSLKEDFRLGQRQYQTMYQCSLLNKFLEMNLSMYKNPENGHLEVFFIVVDVSNNAFLHDPVTGLYNRQKTYLECRRILNEHPDEEMLMVHFDIQHFRLYNSFFGEKEGDQLLCYIADLFRKLAKTQPYGVYGRVEADVFLLCFPCSDHVIAQNQHFIHEYLTSYREDFLVSGNCGVYHIKNRKMSVENMFNRASTAAKNNPNKQFMPVKWFDERMEEEQRQEQQILKDMKKAIEDEEFQVYLQPKYKLINGEAFGAEALVRWIHKKKGMISPGAFIPLFESNGFITTLDRYMWEHVCQLLRKWLDEGKKPAPISVNMSRVSMYSPQTVSFLVQLIKEYQLPPELLNLELTESAYMDDPEEMKKRLLELQHFGFKIMMDDFGSGYSSLNTLRDIPVDYLKVDRMFLASVEENHKSRLVLASVVHMATRLGIPVITEGVETEAQKSFLTSIGCDYVQGFLYAKPMPVSEYEQDYLMHQNYYCSPVLDNQIEIFKNEINLKNDVQHFYDLLPYPIVFAEYVGNSFTYLSANDRFIRTFGLHRDVMEREELIQKHLSLEEYETLRSTYQKTAETGLVNECFLAWKHSRQKKTQYRVRVQYIGKNAYSALLLVTFVDLITP